MIEQLLERCVKTYGELLESEAERAYYFSLCEGLTRDELFDRMSAETTHRLHLQVAYPSRLILSLN